MQPAINRSEQLQPEEQVLPPLKSVQLTLADYPIEIETSQGIHIATIELIKNGSSGIRIHNKNSGQSVNINFTDYFTIGSTTMPSGFFGKDERLISRQHVQIRMHSINDDGSIRLSLQDLNSTNGSQFSVDKTPKSEKKKMGPIATKLCIANNAVGSLSTADGNCSAITSIGKGGKEMNEDAIYAEDNIIAVADGMGGEKGGALAAYWALVSVMKGDRQGTPFKEIPTAAAANLKEKNLHKRSGTTLAMARKRINNNGTTNIEVCSVGDAKVYVISKSQKKMVYESKDQSLVQELLDKGGLDGPLDRYTFEQSNIITNVISPKKPPKDPEYESLNLPVGDTIVVACSDGISDFVTPEEVLEYALKYQNFCGQEIMNLAISRQGRKEGYDLKLNGKIQHVDKNHGDNTSVAVMMA